MRPRPISRRSFLGALAAAAASFVVPKPVQTIYYNGITLRARNIHGLIRVPNELIRYAMPVEQILRDDVAKRISYQLDLGVIDDNRQA